jgi:Ca2+-binding EF-hand superfamily protein
MRRFFPGLSVQTQTLRADTAARSNDAIWKHLGAGKGGKLTEALVGKLPGLLAKLDENEDEMISESELLRETPDVYGFGFRPMRGGAPPTPFLVSLAGTPPGQVAAMLLKKYGKGGKVSREEIGLDEAGFAALDLDRDGKLDARELERFVLRTPDLIFRGRVGSTGGAPGLLESIGLGLSPQRLALLTPSGQGLSKSVRRLSADSVRLSLAKGTRVEWTAMPAQGAVRGFGAARFYQREYEQTLPAGAKGLTREQAEGNGYVAGLFTAADRNADGFLEKKEFSDFVTLIGGSAVASVVLQVDDGGRSLFQVIDGDGNGQLTIRELRDAWKRIAPLCKGGKELARDDLPRQVKITLSDEPVFNQRFAAVPFGGGTPTPVRLSGPVPPWFTKMDRNGDGDISASEWLGTEEDFKKLDLDGDGLISLDEARKAKFDPTKKDDPTKK